MMFREICAFIASKSGFTILPNGTGTIQPGHRHERAPERCILVSEAGGGETVFECPDMSNRMIMVVSRAKTYFAARDDAYVVYDAIHGTAGWNMTRLDGSGSDYLAMTIEALSVPQYIGQDPNGLFEFSTNYIFRMEEASCGS